MRFAHRTIPSKNSTSCSLKNTSSFNRGPPSDSIGLLHKFAHKREVKRPIQVAIEVISRNQLFQRHIHERSPRFVAWFPSLESPFMRKDWK
jgi:hypothetical protein